MRIAAASATSWTRGRRASGHLERSMDSFRDRRSSGVASLSPGDASGGAEGGTRGAGGHEWSFVSRNFGFPARADSSAIPYGSDRIGQKGRSACAEPQPPSTTALTFAVAVSMCRSAPVCGPHRKEPDIDGTSSVIPSRTSNTISSSGKSLARPPDVHSACSLSTLTEVGPLRPPKEDGLVGTAAPPDAQGRRSHSNGRASGRMAVLGT